MSDFNFYIRKIFNIEDFQKIDNIIKYLQEEIATDDKFSKNRVIFLEKTDNMQLFIVFGEKEVFVVKDDGFRLKVIYRVDKENFSYEIILHENKPRIYIKNTTTTLPLNTNYSGDTQTVINKLDGFIK